METVETKQAGRLLVADDDALNRKMLVRCLGGQGYDVEVAVDGPDTLAMIENAEVPFELLLLDVMMPGMNGVDVLKRLRERRSLSELPVVMATAMDETHMIVDTLRLGANDYVTKPFDFPVVLARVKTQLALKRARDEVDKLAATLKIRNRFIRETFGRYLSDEIVETLLERPEGLKLGGEKRVVTIMMSDLRGFTSLSEHLPPEHVVRMLNNYLGTMAEIICTHHGTIDEFIGDAILTIFGAPIERDDDAARAVACAIEMQLAMQRVNEFNARVGYPRLEMGIALNTGEVVVGNIGSEARAKYGVVGSNVNNTSRIESYTLGGQVLISDATRLAAGDDVVIGESLEVQAKGMKRAINVHYLRGVGGARDLWLPESRETLVTLDHCIPVRLSIVDGKDVRGEQYEATIVRMSSSTSELRTPHVLDALTNVRLQIALQDANTDVYGKVVPSQPASASSMTVRFTAIPPEAIRFFEAKMKVKES